MKNQREKQRKKHSLLEHSHLISAKLFAKLFKENTILDIIYISTHLTMMHLMDYDYVVHKNTSVSTRENDDVVVVSDSNNTDKYVYPKRHRRPWSNSEIEQLCREYEIKQYSVQEIADIHERTYDAILYKLKAEDLLYKNVDEDDEEEDDEDDGEEDEDDGEEDEDDEDDEDEDEDDEEDEEDDEDDGEREVSGQLSLFSNYDPDFFDKVLFAYCDIGNSIIDKIFSTSRKWYLTTLKIFFK